MNIEAFREIIISAVIVILYLIICLRICGLRSFSKMAGFDFAITIAVGTLLATPIISSTTSFKRGLVAVGTLFLLQFLISKLRSRSKFFSILVDNKPTLLFKDGKFLTAALNKTRVKKSDVVAKMREANATDLSLVFAVVLEATGDISVLHGDKKVDDILLTDVLEC